jgi:hypothetical protein
VVLTPVFAAEHQYRRAASQRLSMTQPAVASVARENAATTVNPTIAMASLTGEGDHLSLCGFEQHHSSGRCSQALKIT